MTPERIPAAESSRESSAAEELIQWEWLAQQQLNRGRGMTEWTGQGLSRESRILTDHVLITLQM